jgi:hypothetical protein
MEIYNYESNTPKPSCFNKITHKCTHQTNNQLQKRTPPYELAKRLIKAVRNHLHLPYTYNIHNAIHLITELQIIENNK